MNARVLIPVRAKTVVQRISPVTPTAADPTSAPAAANRCLPAASITAPASAKPCHSQLAAKRSAHAPVASRTNTSHLHNAPFHYVVDKSRTVCSDDGAVGKYLPNLTRSSRREPFSFSNNPSPSYHRTLIRSPLRPRNTNTCPENGFCSSLLSTSALSPVNPRRKSVTPAAIQTRVFVGGPIIPVGTPTTRAPTPHRRCLRSAPAPAAVRCGSCPAVLSVSRRIHAPPEVPANSRSPEPAATSWPACTPQVSRPGTADASQIPGSR